MKETMSDNRIKIRICKTTGELELEGSASEVKEWWELLWPEISDAKQEPHAIPLQASRGSDGAFPSIFGEYFTQFRSDITDVDRMLVAGHYAVEKDSERVFTTKVANQLLLDQNIKIGNPSECVRRLGITKKVFVVTGGKFRVSSAGIEYLNSLKTTSAH